MTDFATPSWLLDVVACPLCLGSITPRPTNGDGGSSTFGCVGCGALFPVLAGVPILLHAPHIWMARYRDAILASLAEIDAVSPNTLAIVDGFADVAGRVEPHRFGDDWVMGEGHTSPDAQPPARYADTLGAFVSRANERSPVTVIESMLGDRPLGVTVEIGAGAGVLAARLATKTDHLLVTDLSLRAALRTRAVIGDTEGRVAAAVMDAENLALGQEVVDTLIAVNVIDLLDDPFAFAEEAAERLDEDGRLAVCTPDPCLGGPPDDVAAVDRLIELAGMHITRTEEDVPWLRPHSPRELQIYFTRILVAEHGAAEHDDDHEIN